MKSNFKQSLIMIIAVLIIYAIIWYFFLKKPKSEVSSESSFGHGGGHGGFHGGGRFFHGGRGSWGGWGYPYPYYYPYYDDEPVVVVNSTKCPKGWIWMGAMLGCQKPQGM